MSMFNIHARSMEFMMTMFPLKSGQVPTRQSWNYELHVHNKMLLEM